MDISTLFSSHQEGGGPPTVAVETLGCKVNQYETSYLLEALMGAGFVRVPFRERADVYIVHSCAVTAKAGFQARQLLRRARRANPGALVVVAGCYAQLDADRIAREHLATHILGNPAKFDLVSRLRLPGTFDAPCRLTDAAPRSRDFEILPVSSMHTGRTRAMLKIQDGCDAFCSYCVVPLVRGKSRSLPLRDAVAQIERLVDAGYEEIVLTGIHLGQWGRELAPRLDLCDLLRALDSGRRPPRVRLSSLEPMEIGAELLDLASSLPWICPHLHVPLQSGDAEILERMRRPYGPSQYADLITRIRERLPEAGIGADVLVGFPGETPRQFENTAELIEKLPLTYLHVFPFSPRPGTPAANFPGRIEGGELKRRAKILQELGRSKKREFRQRFVGRRLEALIEKRLDSGTWEGLTANYINVIVRGGDDPRPGKRVPVTITGFIGEDLEGEVVRSEQ
ncbi:MAG: tRNA (N(6)-L-threonylcarbamoyladenosine(37)-C(2))-methylthiotransferase MtaB [Syntrophobacteraceae bacterium]